MRTTISIDDDVFAHVVQYAKLRGVSLGKTVSDLVRRGLNARTPDQTEGGVIVFQLPDDSPVVTSDDVRRVELEGA